MMMTSNQSTGLMSISESGLDQGTDIADHQDPSLPGYLAYLSLGFKLVAAAVTTLLASQVIATIKATRSLHKPHHIFIANLMVADMMLVLIGCLLSTIMTVGFALGEDDLIDCNLFRLPFVPALVMSFSYAIISGDMVAAIRFPYKYKQTMIPRVIASIIAGSWVLALIPLAPLMFHRVDGFINAAQFGTCLPTGDALIEIFVILTLPVSVSSLVALLFNVYVAVRVYYIHRNIDNETQLSGVSKVDEVIKQKSARIKKYMKPIIVVMLGGILITISMSLLYLIKAVAISSPFYHNVMVLIVYTNGFYAVPLLHPFVYGLYFKQIRQPMMKQMKGLLCQSDTTATAQMPRIAWM